MINFEATANVGMEAVLKREIQALGLEDIRVTDGLVSMFGNMEDMESVKFTSAHGSTLGSGSASAPRPSRNFSTASTIFPGPILCPRRRILLRKL